MRGTISSRALLGAVAWIVGGCGGRVPGPALAGGDAGGGGSVLAGLQASGQYDPGANASAFSAAQVQAALANCDSPHGPAVQVTDSNDERALLAGAWVLCPGGSDIPAVFSPGMILAPGGAWTRLVSDGSGGLVATTGVQNQGVWLAFCEASSDITSDQRCIFGDSSDVNVRINAVGDDGSPFTCFGGPMSFESSPRRMFVVESALYCPPGSWDSGTFDLWLVPL